MSADIYCAVKPGSSRRTLPCTIALLVIALALAAFLSRARGRESLTDRFVVRGWGLSFRPPRRFVPGDVVHRRSSEVLPYYTVTPSGDRAVLAMSRFPLSAGDDPASICRKLVRVYGPNTTMHRLARLPLPSAAMLGPFEGVEIIVPDRTTVVRMAFTNESIGLAVVLSIEGSPIDESLYAAFDGTCRSVQVVRH